MALKRKFIELNAIDGERFRLDHAEALRGKNESGSEVEILKIEGNALKLVTMPELASDPTEANHIVRKSFVDTKVSQLEGSIAGLDLRLDTVEDRSMFLMGSFYNDALAVFADGQPGVEDPSALLRDGWYYENLQAGQKINWYFFDGSNAAAGAQIALEDFGAYAVVTFDSLASGPILGVYTMATGTGDIMPGFAHSRIAYSVSLTGKTIGKKYLVYFGQNPTIHPELERIELVKSESSSAGDQNPAEIVFTVSFGTNSGAAVGNVKMMVESLGVYSPEYKSKIGLKIRHAEKAEFDALAASVLAADSALEARIEDNEAAITLLNANSVTEGSVDYKVQQGVAQILGGAVPESLDTLAEIASYIQSDETGGALLVGRVGVLETKVETLEGDATVLNSVDYKVAAEAALRVAADDALAARLDVVEGSGEGSVAKAEQDAKDYADGLMASEVASREAEDATFFKVDGSRLLEGSVYAKSPINLGSNLQISGCTVTAGSAVVTVSGDMSRLSVNNYIVGGGLQANSKIIAIGEQQFTLDKTAISNQTNINLFRYSGFSSIQANSVSFASPSATSYGNMVYSGLPGGGSALRLSSSGQYDAGLISANQTGNTGRVRIETGNSSSFASGDIELKTGTAGTTRGKIEMDATELLLSSMQIKGLAVGVDATDAVAMSQLTSGVQEAKDYADTKVAALVGSAPEVLDTLQELSAALGGDANFAATIAGQIGGLGDRLDVLEGGAEVEGSVAKQAADTLQSAKSYTDAQLDTLVIQQQTYETKTLGAADVSNGYIDVSAEMVSTPWVMISGVMARPEIDYQWSEQRITFLGEWAVGGLSAIEESDVVHVWFMKEFMPFA